MTAIAEPAGVQSGIEDDRPAGRDFGPIRWLPRALVLAPIAWFVFLKVPDTVDYAAVAADACIYSMVGLSLNIIVGYTGQLSLGHQGFVGVGAFTAAYGFTKQGVPFLLTFPLAALVAALFALVLGLVALRITGLYLALITLVFGTTLEASIFQIPEITNQGAGQLAERPESFLFFPDGWLFSDGNFYLLCLAFLLLACYIDFCLLRSKGGRALLALKENERVAEAFGVNVTFYKLIAFVLSGSIAGVAGALLAFRLELVTGSSFAFFPLALTFVLMTVVGGLGSRLGVILGATTFATLDFVLHETPLESVNKFIFRSSDLEQYSVAFIGAALLLLTVTKYRGGIGEQIRWITQWLSGKPFNARLILHPNDGDVSGAVEGSSVRA